MKARWAHGEGGPSARRASLREDVLSLRRKAGKDDWDGEGAARLEDETVALAQELIDRFPDDAVLSEFLDVDVTPHGEVDFDWAVDRSTMLTVSALYSRGIVFSGLFHGTRVRGCEPWRGALPPFVQFCFERLSERAVIAKRGAPSVEPARRHKRRGGIDFKRLEADRKRLGIKQASPEEAKAMIAAFHDPALSRQVLGLEDDD